MSSEHKKTEEITKSMQQADKSPTRFARIVAVLDRQFAPVEMRLENESHTHSVPENSETHFKLLLVSGSFKGVSRVARNRMVYAALGGELQTGLHALTMRLLTPEEMLTADLSEFTSPPCHGGSKR